MWKRKKRNFQKWKTLKKFDTGIILDLLNNFSMHKHFISPLQTLNLIQNSMHPFLMKRLFYKCSRLYDCADAVQTHIRSSNQLIEKGFIWNTNCKIQILLSIIQIKRWAGILQIICIKCLKTADSRFFNVKYLVQG
jgi:hypothetical protein